MRKSGLYLSWLIACVATLASLYFGEIKHHEPCSLCWYQRIAIFPLAIILGIAAFKNGYGIIPYVLPLALIGLFFAIIHVLLQYAPSSSLEAFCTGKEACAVKRSLFGRSSLSILSLIGFTLLNLLLFWTWKSNKKM